MKDLSLNWNLANFVPKWYFKMTGLLYARSLSLTKIITPHLGLTIWREVEAWKHIKEKCFKTKKTPAWIQFEGYWSNEDFP